MQEDKPPLLVEETKGGQEENGRTQLEFLPPSLPPAGPSAPLRLFPLVDNFPSEAMDTGDTSLQTTLSIYPGEEHEGNLEG